MNGLVRAEERAQYFVKELEERDCCMWLLELSIGKR